MMNEAEKKLMKAETLKDIYNKVEELLDGIAVDIDYYFSKRTEFLEKIPSIETSQLDKSIEELTIKQKTLAELNEKILQMM